MMVFTTKQKNFVLFAMAVSILFGGLLGFLLGHAHKEQATLQMHAAVDRWYAEHTVPLSESERFWKCPANDNQCQEQKFRWGGGKNMPNAVNPSQQGKLIFSGEQRTICSYDNLHYFDCPTEGDDIHAGPADVFFRNECSDGLKVVDCQSGQAVEMRGEKIHGTPLTKGTLAQYEELEIAASWNCPDGYSDVGVISSDYNWRRCVRRSAEGERDKHWDNLIVPLNCVDGSHYHEQPVDRNVVLQQCVPDAEPKP